MSAGEEWHEDLTDKQRRFVEEYTVDFNAAAAARRAGYSETCATEIGYENLRKPHIAEALQSYLQNEAERVSLTREEIIQGLRKEANRTGKGSSHSARVSAWKQLARHKGMLKDRVEHSGEVPAIEVILTDEVGEDEG